MGVLNWYIKEMAATCEIDDHLHTQIIIVYALLAAPKVLYPLACTLVVYLSVIV